jgi:glycosyltransferase involved in cell wall biosynthesis
MDVAIAHDYVTQRGGAERVVLTMLKAFPSAPLHTSLCNPASSYPEFLQRDLHTSALNRFGLLRHDHRRALPLLAPAFSRLHIAADVVVCSSSGWAHGVTTEGRKIVYCHAPARWLYQTAAYLGASRGLVRTGLAVLRPFLTRWDKLAAHTAHRYLTNSSAVRAQIRRQYGIDAEVLPPPHTINPAGPQIPVDGLEPGFFLCVSRLLPYKHVDVLLEVFRKLPAERLVIVGQGPEERYLRAVAPPNAMLLGTVSDVQLRWLYASATGLLAASFEDYGLTPLEAAAFGTPTAALRWGGYLDTVVEGETGLFFDRPETARIRQAVQELTRWQPSQSRLLAHAACYSEAGFIRRLRAIVQEEGGVTTDRSLVHLSPGVER